jgi:phage terminase large subunit GpA-like protein
VSTTTIKTIGREWLIDQADKLTDEIIKISPAQFSEENRYLPESVTRYPGYMRFDINPFMREIVECFDPYSPVREVNLKKGVQITYTTLIESGLFFYMAHVKTVPCMWMSADKELVDIRVENNILPMLKYSGFGDIIQTSDKGNNRKTGQTKDTLQWQGGGYLLKIGAQSASKMRQQSVQVIFKDELDGWPDTVGKDGDPDSLSDDRAAAYWEVRKIFRGSTPLIKGTSKIEKQYQRGDQRKYLVLCKKCNAPQELRWSYGENEKGGFYWETEGGILVPESVQYRCKECGEPHYEHDKERLFAEEHGAHWKPTAKPVEPGIRSYHLPALYSPIGMQPWSKSVGMYLQAFDTKERKVKDISKFQVFYNNVLAEPFEIMGSKIGFTSVSLHRRSVYRLGEIPNKYAIKNSGSPILLLTCQVDVHKSFLAVGIMGWCKDSKPYLVEYLKLEDEDCTEPTSKVWGQLRELIEEKEYTADDGKKYRVVMTLIDAGYANDTVTSFCADYASGVVPVLGRDRPGKANRIKEFSEFTTQAGTTGYTITVDHYKDRLAPVLRREWTEEAGIQKPYHFNAPIDTPDKALKELTVETRREKTDDKGNTVYFWHRPGNARNELWDVLVYGHAAVEIIAWSICIQHFKLKTVDWPHFWEYLEKNQIYFKN